MDQQTFDVVGIGNALVDVLAHADDAFLAEHDLAKGTMTLVDAGRAEALYAAMPPGIEMSGGSAANTIAGVASLGGKAAYIGKVADDQLGAVFRHDIRALGVAFESTPGVDAATGRCLILVTPDAQRTMQTHLGASAGLTPGDVSAATIAAARITYLEGYLFDPPQAQEAFRRAASLAHDAGRLVALTLSDPFCVGRFRQEFLHLVRGHVDILFANEAEICALYEVQSFDDALRRVRDDCQIAALTRSEKGSVVVAGDDLYAVAADAVERVVDTTGAGDLYAAGFLYGFTQEYDLETCGRIGSVCAAEVISHFGARPERPLRELLAGALVR